MSQFFFPSGVELIEQLYDKYLILAGVSKLAAAAQLQGLIERALENDDVAAQYPRFRSPGRSESSALLCRNTASALRIAFLEIGQFSQISMAAVMRSVRCRAAGRLTSTRILQSSLRAAKLSEIQIVPVSLAELLLRPEPVA